MKLVKIAGTCSKDDCPNVFTTDRGTVAVQGYLLTGLTVPEGEAVVEIPTELLREATLALGT